MTHVPKPLVSWLLDTSTSPTVGDEVSSVASAVKEARILTGRDPRTGVEAPSNDHSATWAGALVWFIVLEQLSTCFRPQLVAAPSESRQPIAESLMWFADVGQTTAVELDRLRDRFAHDYSLEHPSGRRRYRLTGKAGPLLRPHNTRPEVSLHELAETVERALAAVAVLCEHGDLAYASDVDEAIIRRRFSMVLEPGDAPLPPSA